MMFRSKDFEIESTLLLQLVSKSKELIKLVNRQVVELIIRISIRNTEGHDVTSSFPPLLFIVMLGCCHKGIEHEIPFYVVRIYRTTDIFHLSRF